MLRTTSIAARWYRELCTAYIINTFFGDSSMNPQGDSRIVSTPSSTDLKAQISEQHHDQGTPASVSDNHVGVDPFSRSSFEEESRDRSDADRTSHIEAKSKIESVLSSTQSKSEAVVLNEEYKPSIFESIQLWWSNLEPISKIAGALLTGVAIGEGSLFLTCMAPNGPLIHGSLFVLNSLLAYYYLSGARDEVMLTKR